MRWLGGAFRGVRKTRRLYAVAVTATLVLVAGCGRGPVDADVVVTLDGEKIPYSEFESYLRDNVDASDLPLGAGVLGQLFDQFLDERLLIRLARERGLGRDGEGRDGGEARIDHRAAVTYLLRRSEAAAPTETELRAYYEAHKERYRRPESVRLRQILVHEADDAEAAYRALRDGEDFDQVAARFSQVPMAQLGDDGRLTREDLPAAFADAVFELDTGEISEILPAEYGYHVFQVVERFHAAEASFPEVADDIREILEEERLDDLVASFVAEARGRYNVRVHRANFPFDYRGSYVQKEYD